jgi:hypothetical protein
LISWHLGFPLFTFFRATGANVAKQVPSVYGVNTLYGGKVAGDGFPAVVARESGAGVVKSGMGKTPYSPCHIFQLIVAS